MQAWLKSFPRIDENVNRLGYWVSFFGLVSAAMSWAAGYVTPLAQYGWGTAVYVGVGAACLILLTLTASLALWRRFYPLTVSSTDSTTAELSKAAANDDNGQIEAIKAIIFTLEGKTEDISNRLAEAERGIAQNKASLEELRTKAEMLARSLRARDAQSIIKEADQVIMSTYKRILEEAYPDEAAWADDYAAWEKAMIRIDNLMSQWTQQHHKPFLDLRLKDFEAGAPPPRQSNINSDANVTRYKTACIAQSSYANRRDGILGYFAAIVVDV